MSYATPKQIQQVGRTLDGMFRLMLKEHPEQEPEIMSVSKAVRGECKELLVKAKKNKKSVTMLQVTEIIMNAVDAPDVFAGWESQLAA